MAAGGDTDEISVGNTAFSIDLYRNSVADNADNVVFSPLSISMAMAMTSVGAGGETDDAIRSTMHFPQYDNPLHNGYLRLRKHIADHADAYPVSIANALWCEQSMPVSRKFLNHTERYYEAGLQTVDFLNAAEDARLQINAWTSKHTNGKIVDLLTEGTVKPKTRLILTNAIHFDALWQTPFAADRTRETPFHTSDGAIETPMMHLTTTVPFRQFEGFSAVSIPYKMERLQMIVLLPNESDNISVIEDSLSQSNLGGWLQALYETPQKVNLAIPRFKLTQQLDLTNALTSLGMGIAFSDEANFRGITIAAKLQLSAVIHKAFIDVNEKGTEAAAATGVVMGVTSVGKPAPSFTADHPFMFIIRDNVTGFILFIGRVMNPADVS
jgi:serpin B